MDLKSIFGGLLGGSRKVDLWRRFERLREGTAGTMSTFFKVRDTQTGEVFGLKLIDREKTDPIEKRYGGLNKPSEGEIGMAIAALGDPRVAKTLEWGVASGGESYVLQEFVEGRLLNTVLNSGESIPAPVRLELVRQAAAAVAVVHKAGFVHRDICPRNLMLRPDGRLVLFDFGLTVPDKPAFLQPGNRIGTPQYLAPEIVRRKQADKRLDIFSLGVTAFQICTSQLPWPKVVSGSAARTNDSPPAEIKRFWPDIPPALEAIIGESIAADPDKRPPTAEQFMRQLAKVKL